MKISSLLIFKKLIGIGLILGIIPSAFSAYTATTTKEIIGNAPVIPDATITKVASNIAFTIKDSMDFSYDYTPNTESEVYFPLSSQFSLITPKLNSFTLADTDITDVNGDTLSITQPYTVTNLIYQWKDSSGNAISNSSTSNLGGNICTDSSSYIGPYTLDVSFDMTINTEYGVPRSTTTTVTKSFTVNANDGICYIQPGVLALNIPSGWPEGSNNASGGSNSINRSPAFDSDVFVQSKGFKAWVSKKFPTTAFPEARFAVVPYNTASGYTYSINTNPNSALVDQQTYGTGQFKFSTNTPMQDSLYVLKAVNNSTGASYYYGFKLGSSRSWFNWLSTSPTSSKTYANALSACSAAGADIPTRAELTNSIYSTTTSSTSMSAYASNNGYSRGIGTGLTAEWGKIYYYSPIDGNRKDMMATVPSSVITKNFRYDYYWTKDVPDSSVSTTNNYIVGAVEGNILATSKTSSYYVFCVQ